MPFVDTVPTTAIDYLIIGGGTTGLALAARLTEDPDTVVLVVEAGVHHGSVPEIDTPGYMGRTIANPKYDWTFLSVPQQHANNRLVLQPRGKGLGGSSHNNFLGVFRPAKDEIDAIEGFGNPGWNWESVLHYIKKSETTIPSNLSSSSDAVKYSANPDPKFHGLDGPIKKSFPIVWSELHAKLFDTAENLGIPRNPEPNNGINSGSVTSFVSVNSNTGKRSYSASEYLEPNIDRKNLLVMTETLAAKVIFDSRDQSALRAVGIEIIKDGRVSVIDNVRKDVILAAGSLQTPQILELSGIGDPEILSKHGIKTLIDLPGVGENLQDHIGVSTIVEVDTNDETMDVLGDPAIMQQHEELYKQKKGLFASVPAPAFVFVPPGPLGFEPATRAKSTTEYINSFKPSLKAGLEKQYKVLDRLLSSKDHAVAELLQYAGHQPIPYSIPVPGKKYTSLFCVLMHPLSRGSVHIASFDPSVPPAIDPKYFSNDMDLEQLTAIVGFALKVYKTQPLGAHVKAPKIPSQEIQDKGAEGLKEYIKENCGTSFHPVGTAAMLPRADGGVVDSELRVYGTSNLRVVDLSILPLEISSHTQSVAYAIAEKAADIIRQSK